MTLFAWLVQTLQVITGYGYVALALFAVTLASCMGLDLFVQLWSLPDAVEFKSLTQKGRKEALDALWDSILDLRRLSYAHFRYKQKSSPETLALTVAVLSRRLVNRHTASEPVNVTVKGGVDGAAIRLNLTDLGKSITLLPSALKESDIKEGTVAAGLITQNAAGIDSLLFVPRLEIPTAESMDLPPQYQIDKQVSSGGMGIIFKGSHRHSGVALAIKIMHPQHASNPNNLRRFEQEARTASTLQHPNIVVVHDFGVSQKSIAYLIMEWLNGPDLQQCLQDSGTMKLERALSIFLQCANALSHSHKHGIVHRDIKPSNIILSHAEHASDFVKIVDFGIAKLLTSEDGDRTNLTQTGDILGSPKYMSPEQCKGEMTDSRSDIYSLGCVMYETIVGTPAFTAENPGQMFYKHITEMPARPTSINPNIEYPQFIEPMLFKLLQKEPAKRYASMDELEVDLRNIKSALLAAKSG